jgi:hypothetical protein
VFTNACLRFKLTHHYPTGFPRVTGFRARRGFPRVTGFSARDGFARGYGGGVDCTLLGVDRISSPPARAEIIIRASPYENDPIRVFR